MSATAAQQFLRDAAVKSADMAHREIIRRGMESYDAAHLKGRARINDWEAARERCQEIKRDAINHLDRYLLQFEEQVKARGGHVFWAANSEEACTYVRNLAVERGVRTVVKSKSMVTEEIHLGPALEKAGIKVWETDFGEFIVQLREEGPYHIVTPCMHLKRDQIATLFREKLDPGVNSDDPAYLMTVARRILRQAFFEAEMGISGANFLVADAGAIAISTNEGNGRLCTSIPRIHVVVTGIEKVIPRLEDLAVLWPVLATSGTGPGDYDLRHADWWSAAAGRSGGPEEFHVVLVDNGRSQLLADAEQREVLHCIRCGACLDVSGLPPRGRPHLWHDLSRLDRQRAYATSEWDQGVQTSFVCVVAVRGLQQRLSGENRSASSPAAKPPQRYRGGSNQDERADHVPGLEPRHAASTDLRAGWVGCTQGSSDCLRLGTGRFGSGPDAGLEPASHAGYAAFEILSRTVEKRPWHKLAHKLKTQAASGFWNGFAGDCAPLSPGLLR